MSYRMKDYFKNELKLLDEDWTTLEKSMAKIIEEVTGAVAPKLDKKKGCFELLVFNFVIKTDLTPLLTGVKSIMNEKAHTELQQLAIEKFISEVQKHTYSQLSTFPRPYSKLLNFKKAVFYKKKLKQKSINLNLHELSSLPTLT